VRCKDDTPEGKIKVTKTLSSSDETGRSDLALQHSDGHGMLPSRVMNRMRGDAKSGGLVCSAGTTATVVSQRSLNAYHAQTANLSQSSRHTMLPECSLLHCTYQCVDECIQLISNHATMHRKYRDNTSGSSPMGLQAPITRVPSSRRVVSSTVCWALQEEGVWHRHGKAFTLWQSRRQVGFTVHRRRTRNSPSQTITEGV
jgi:hypothetical protein